MSQLSFLDDPPPAAKPAKEPAAPASPTPKDEVQRWAEMSVDQLYRWVLGRRWGPGATDFWCGINPSDANGQRDDPSARRMMDFGRAWGSGGLLVGNLAARVSSDPDTLYTVADPIGSLCDKFLREMAEEAVRSGGRIIAIWGNSVRFDDFAPPALRGRDEAVLKMLTEIGPVYSLARNKDGSPRHPHARGRARVPDGTKPEIFMPHAPPERA